MAGSPKVVICGAGIAGIAAAHALAVEHGLTDVTIVEQGNPLSSPRTNRPKPIALVALPDGPDRLMNRRSI